MAWMRHAVAGLQGREAELAGVAGVHDPTGEADRDAGRGVRLEVALLRRAPPGSCA